METHSRSSPIRTSSRRVASSSMVPLVISSTGQPAALASASIASRSGWANGSPNPPKNTVGRGDTARTPSMTRAKVSADIVPGGSSQTLRMQVRQRRLHRVVGST